MTIGEVAARLGVPGLNIRYCGKMGPDDLRHRASSQRRFATLAQPPHGGTRGGDPS